MFCLRVLTIFPVYISQALLFGRWKVGGVVVRGSISYRLTNPSLWSHQPKSKTSKTVGWWVCMICYPLLPLPRPSTSQIIPPVVHITKYTVSSCCILWYCCLCLIGTLSSLPSFKDGLFSSLSLNLTWKVALMLVPKNTEKGGYFHALTLKYFLKKGTFFISTPRYHTKGYVFCSPMLRCISSMAFTATDIYIKRCFTFSWYIMF